MNEKLLVGIGVGVVVVSCGALVLRAGAQSAPNAVIAAPAIGKTVMRMHCSNCKIVRPETIEPRVAIEPQRYWRGQLPVPQGYTHWVPPIDDYVPNAPDIPLIPLPEIFRGSTETTGSTLTPGGTMGGSLGPMFNGSPRSNIYNDELVRQRRQRESDQDDKKREDALNDMLKDYQQNKNKR